MTAIQLHRPDPKAGDPITWTGWRLSGPLAEWRTDAPESGPFCVVCLIRINVGDRYALRLPLTVACVACSRITVPDPVPARPRPPVTDLVSRRFGGLSTTTQPKPPARRATAAGPTEERTCARVGCDETFAVPVRSTRKHHSARCRGLDGWEAAKARRGQVVAEVAAPGVVAEAPLLDRAPRSCVACGLAFTPDDRHRATCCWTCEMRAAEGHLLASCPCFACAGRRADQGLPPLAGGAP